MTGRRFIKTHLPWDLLPAQLQANPDAKIIYTMRNPKDTAISLYHYCLLAHQVNISFAEFLELFFDDKWIYGSVKKHIIEYYKRRNQPNVLIVKYEDMKRDLPSVIKQCAQHLQVERKLTDQDIGKLCEHVQFEKMEQNPSVNLESIVFRDPVVKKNVNHETYRKIKFIRKGQVGDWQNYLKPDLNAKFDKWIHENFDGTGLTFEYV